MAVFIHRPYCKSEIAAGHLLKVANYPIFCPRSTLTHMFIYKERLSLTIHIPIVAKNLCKYAVDFVINKLKYDNR